MNDLRAVTPGKQTEREGVKDLKQSRRRESVWTTKSECNKSRGNASHSMQCDNRNPNSQSVTHPAGPLTCDACPSDGPSCAARRGGGKS